MTVDKFILFGDVLLSYEDFLQRLCNREIVSSHKSMIVLCGFTLGMPDDVTA